MLTPTWAPSARQCGTLAVPGHGCPCSPPGSKRKQAHREYITWMWEREPDWRNVLQEVFIGPHGYACLTRLEPHGWQVVWIREIGADGLVHRQRLHRSRTPGS